MTRYDLLRLIPIIERPADQPMDLAAMTDVELRRRFIRARAAQIKRMNDAARRPWHCPPPAS